MNEKTPYRPKHDNDTPVTGNIEGLKKTLLKEMESLYAIESDKTQFAPMPLLEAMAKYTGIIGREIAVYIGRDGTVLDVIVGEARIVSLPSIRTRRSLLRLSGVRCLHTHPNGVPLLSELDKRTLESCRFDAMAAVGVTDGAFSGISMGVLRATPEGETVELFGPCMEVPQERWIDEIRVSDREIGMGMAESENRPERAVLVCIDQGYSHAAIAELKGLTETAGAEIAKVISQNRQKPDPATYIGRGKAEEIALSVVESDADIVIIDDELSGTQLRNLEQITGVRVVDRTMLILDIFAQRAKSREGKLQVELAQLQYRLPRLSGAYAAMSRLGGGIGTRGPGESQLETDRRHIRRQIEEIKRQLEDVKKQRDVRRNLRSKNDMPVAALVGYTNAGKSTLLNLLSGADVLAEDKLFATLDPVTRRVMLPSGHAFLLTDTVGFIHKLPHHLVESFRSTLEEVVYADLLIIVNDMSAPDMEHQREVVDDVLVSLGAGDKPRLHVMNKIDIAGNSEFTLEKPKNVPISALTGQGAENLLERIEQILREARLVITALIPYSQGAILSRLHESAVRVEEEHREIGTFIKAEIDPGAFLKLPLAFRETVQIIENAALIAQNKEEFI